jgi:hypothetical protein
MESDIKSCWGQYSHFTRHGGQNFCQNMCLMSGHRTHMHNVTRIMHWIIFLGINCQCGVDLIHDDSVSLGEPTTLVPWYKHPIKHLLLLNIINICTNMCAGSPKATYGGTFAFLTVKPHGGPFFFFTQEMLNLDSRTIIKSDYVWRIIYL